MSDGVERASTEGTAEERIHQIFREHLNVTVPDDHVDVIATGLLDSLGVAQLIMEVETEFDIEIDLGQMDLDDFRSVASMARFVEGQAPA